MQFRTSVSATVRLGGNECALVGLPVLLRIVVVLHTGCRRDRWKASRREITAHREWSRRRCDRARSEEHTSELQSLMRISYAVFCLKKKKYNKQYRKDQKQSSHSTKTPTNLTESHSQSI